MNMVTESGKRKKRRPKRDNPEQSKRFIDAAKALGVDESGEAFRKAMRGMKPKAKPRGSN